MRITFDPHKDRANVAKHGLSLREAEQIDWSSVIRWTDRRRNYNEPRMCALGLLRGRVYCVAFVDRDDAVRVISLRKANARECKRYAEQT